MPELEQDIPVNAPSKASEIAGGIVGIGKAIVQAHVDAVTTGIPEAGNVLSDLKEQELDPLAILQEKARKAELERQKAQLADMERENGQKDAIAITNLRAANSDILPQQPKPQEQYKPPTMDEWFAMSSEAKQKYISTKPPGMPDAVYQQWRESIGDYHEFQQTQGAQKRKEQFANDHYGEYVTKVMSRGKAALPEQSATSKQEVTPVPAEAVEQPV